MNERIQNAITNIGTDHIMPFLWAISGVDVGKSIELMKVIKRCGINAVCIESRTFEDFCGDSWWPYIERILNEAHNLDMKVWILDDIHFPTGFAANHIEKKYPNLRRLQLAEFHVDVIGPRRTQILLKPYSGDDELLGVVAIKRTGTGEELTHDYKIVETEKDAEFYSFDVPDGIWRVFELWVTHEGTNQTTACVNMIDPESVQVQVDAVYEAHFDHLSRYFGKELAGFFSDEPCFGNDFLMRRSVNSLNHYKTVGMPGLALPWRHDLDLLLARRIEESNDLLALLPLLWYDGENACDIRIAYMNLVSELYGKCFSQKIGNWCREHNVQYIGHIIEDNGSHCRLGGSPGHYYRSVEGQDMAGVDVVLQQMLPGFIHTDHATSLSVGFVEPLFYSFVLPKLGASLAHIRPHMQNRAMCEIFGVYGWALDAATMKWLIDHFLVNGINYFVPHAFSPLFPNDDCPPHFFADGINPQFEDFSIVMRYLGTMTELLIGNRPTKIAVLYHAEMEWSGKAFMKDDVICEYLSERQIDYDIVPADDFSSAVIRDGNWHNGNADYRLLILPAAEYLPNDMKMHINRMKAEGLTIVQINKTTDGLKVDSILLNDLDVYIQQLGLKFIHTYDAQPYLRVLQLEGDGESIFMLFNESITDSINTKITFPAKGQYTMIDLLGNRIFGGCTKDGNIDLSLTPYESVVITFDGTTTQEDKQKQYSKKLLTCDWEIAVADCDSSDVFSIIKKVSQLQTIEKIIPGFSGVVRYTAIINVKDDINGIQIDNFGDTAEVKINGISAGRRVCSPYIFQTKGMWRKGENTLEVLVYTTLGGRMKDYNSAFMAMNPPGLNGPVYLLT